MREFLEDAKARLLRCRVKTCCSLLPLRIGLICLAFINALFSLMQVIGAAHEAEIFHPIVGHVQAGLLGDVPSKTVCVVPPTIDLAFDAVLLCGLYRYDNAILSVYSWYLLVSIFLSFIVYGFLEALINPIYLLLIVLVGVYQVYLLVLVRSFMIETHMQRVDKSQFIYKTGREVVIIRDAESPTPGALPAIMEPPTATSITTLNTVNEQNTLPTDSRYSTLRTGTLNYKTREPVDVTVQRASTLPRKEIIIQKPVNAQRIGAIQALAGSSNTLPREVSPTRITSTTTTATIHSSVPSTSKVEVDKKENKKPETVLSESEDDKTKDAPKKKKRGLFSRAPKESKKTAATGEEAKKADVAPDVPIFDFVTPKLPTTTLTTDSLKRDMASQTIVVTPVLPAVVASTKAIQAIEENDNKIENIEESNIENDKEKEKEAPQKKKRELFKKTSKETKKQKDEDKNKSNK